MMINSPAKKAIVIATDGASMELVLNMVKWGHMPHVAKLLQRGVYRPMVGAFPTLTPPGWTSLYTGSWHSTHEVMDFNIRAVGKPLSETVWGINTALSKSEYLWNTAERAGKIPILVKVEMSWPPTIQKGIQIEGTGPGVSNHHQIAGYHLFVGGKWAPRPIGGERDPESVDPSALQEDMPYDPIQITVAEAALWQNLPKSERPYREVELTLTPLKRGRGNMLRGTKSQSKHIYGLIYARTSQGYDAVRVCRSRDARDSYCDLQEGTWSEWLLESFEIDGEQVVGNIRMKLISLSKDGSEFELFVPQIWPIEGYGYPRGIANKLYRKLGPFLQNPARDALGLIDDDTYFELLEYYHQHLASVAQELASTNEWDILFNETHASDYGDHFFLGQADETSGADPNTVKRCFDGLARTYSSIDSWIGRIVEIADDDTVVVIASDHGGTSTQFKPVVVNDVLAKAGLLAYKNNGEIDWTKTRAAHIGLIHVFINLEGREPNGIVDPNEYEATQREIIDALLDYKDPETGFRPFSLAISRENAEILRLSGDLVGDVVFGVHPSFDGAHGRQLPVGSFGMSGQHSVFIMAGPGVKKGLALHRSVNVVDVAPTLCYLLGWPMPRNAEGKVIYEALEDPNWHLK
ncbi:MAG: alkaline phosphatase family protein [Candidatus Bathyarchaeota archaeon]|nr:alkaline phosphatase family protein [Candidatus Bathyarchaeota archaeon]